MKKVGIAILVTIIIAIFFIIISITLRSSTNAKYSHNDIVDLLNKGLQSMDNISFDRTNTNGIVTYYYKQDKKKMVSHYSDIYSIEKDGKTYMISKEKKTMVVKTNNTLDGYDVRTGSLQCDALDIERVNKNNNNNNDYRYEYVYIKDEELENKDCIFVKEAKYYLDSKKYVDNFLESRNGIPVYWIEKSSGMVIGAGFMESGKKTATPQAVIYNIKYGEVTDDMFNDMENIPSDYQIIVDDNGKIQKVQ